jgi:hypothetical protein
MAVMSDLRVLADALYAEEVARARAMSPEDKLLEGPRLFDRACRLMAAGIRHEHPQLDEAAVKALVIQRLAIADRLDGRELVWREELAPGVD